MLVSLNLTSTKLKTKGAQSLLITMKTFSNLKVLTLDRNLLDGAKLKALKDMLECNKGLETLSLNHC